MRSFTRSFPFSVVPVLAALVGLAACSSSEAPTAAEPATEGVTAVGVPAAASAHHRERLAHSGPFPTTTGGFVVQPLGRGSFLDDIDVKFTIKQGHGAVVAHVRDPSDVLVARLTFQSGGSVGWHSHHGPVIVTVASGALTLIDGDGCERRVYAAGTAFVDPGQGHVHLAFNDTASEAVVYATFLDVPAGQPATIPADNPGCRP